MLRKLPNAIATACVLLSPMQAFAQGAIPPSVATPDVVTTSRGTFDFKDGVPTEATAQALYDQHDFTFAYRAFMDTMRGVSIRAARRGLEDMGVKKNEVMVFSELMDAKSLFLTPNADTIYVMGWIDLSDGPVVIEIAARLSRHRAGRLVPLGDRHGQPRARPRPRRQIPDRPARL